MEENAKSVINSVNNKGIIMFLRIFETLFFKHLCKHLDLQYYLQKNNVFGYYILKIKLLTTA